MMCCILKVSYDHPLTSSLSFYPGHLHLQSMLFGKLNSHTSTTKIILDPLEFSEDSMGYLWTYSTNMRTIYMCVCVYIYYGVG